MPRPTLASLLEDFRNWNKTQDWMLNKQRDIYGNEDPDTIALNEKLAGIGTADMGMMGSSVGGLAAMLRASHGSPHLFNKFDFSKIGTGEGAQAYGHGGYFAQGFDSPVAKGYRTSTSNGFNLPNGESIQAIANLIASRGDKGEQMARRVYAELGKNLEPTIEAAKKAIDENSYLYNVELKWPDAAREAADPLGEHHLLDWDAPLSEQKKSIQNAVKKYWQENRIFGDPSKLTGEGIYGSIQAAALGNHGPGSFNRNAAAEAASMDLNYLGIPGIRYLDQGSRGAGTGSRNYVMFDDRIPNIVSRNGVSLTDLLRR